MAGLCARCLLSRSLSGGSDGAACGLRNRRCITTGRKVQLFCPLCYVIPLPDFPVGNVATSSMFILIYLILSLQNWLITTCVCPVMESASLMVFGDVLQCVVLVYGLYWILCFTKCKFWVGNLATFKLKPCVWITAFLEVKNIYKIVLILCAVSYLYVIFAM